MFKVGSIFIPVSDIEKSSSWYVKYLGATKIDVWEGGAGFYLPTGSTQLALIKVNRPQPTEFTIQDNQKNAYYNFVVDNIVTVHQYFNNNGVITTDIQHMGEMAFFDFFDIDGNPFSVVNEVKDSPYHSENVKRMQEK